MKKQKDEQYLHRWEIAYRSLLLFDYKTLKAHLYTGLLNTHKDGTVQGLKGIMYKGTR